MSLKDRVAKLERQQAGPGGLSGVFAYKPRPINIDGIIYEAIEDVPAEIRSHFEHLSTGTISDRHGHTIDATAITAVWNDNEDNL